MHVLCPLIRNHSDPRRVANTVNTVDQLDSVACEEGALVVATSLTMFILCALSGALLVLCVVLSRACRTTYVSSYWLADCVKHTDTNYTVSIFACTLHLTESLVPMCTSNR